MNRNTESRFAELPQVNVDRSIFDLSHSHKTSFNVGQLIPFFWTEVLPGDTFQTTTSIVARLQTMLTPIMDNIALDTYYYYVPARLTWNHFRQFMGENTESAWLPATEYSIPLLSYPEGGFDIGTIADYMGIPTGVAPVADDDKPIALPFRAYALICNEWFRDQNLTDPLNIPLGDANQTGSNGDNYILDTVNGGKPFQVAKFHDYFTSALPAPQKGNAVAFNVAGDWVPVGTRSQTHDPVELGSLYTNTPATRRGIPALYDTANGQSFGNNYFFGKSGISTTYDIRDPQSPLTIDANPPDTIALQFNEDGVPTSPGVTGANRYKNANELGMFPTNLWADMQQIPSISVNDLRLAFQLQKFYEKNARAGTRYRETLREHFGVTSPDSRMMIPEYLGGHRIPIQIHQITNTAQGENDFLGDLGAMSNTADVHEDFIKSFTEHGYIIGVCCVRYDHSYPQGLAKAWSRRSITDFYWPVFANIGEQPIHKREIYLGDGPNDKNGDVFGYQEAWAEYRYMSSRVSGEMRPSAPQSLASWHLADDYAAQPSLSDAWIREDPSNVDRTLAVTSAVSNQIFADFFVQSTVTRPMPVYSIPGLIDHH